MMKSNILLSPFATRINKFISFKRALGLKYGIEERYMKSFDRWCVEHKIREANLTRNIVESWGYKRSEETLKTHSNRQALMREFARFLNDNGEIAHVCSLPIKPFNSSGFVPYIFTDKELRALFRAADSLKKTSYTQYRHVTLPIILRVLYGCGLRTNEVRALKRNEVDLDRGLLTIMDSKNGKDRLIPVSEELAKRLRDYDERIKALCPACEYFFPDCNGSQIKEDAIYRQFRKLIAGIGIPHYGRGKGPRVHDFRHTFAVHSMRQMEQAGMDLYTALPILSVYLGHGSITSTEKYLRLTSQAYPEIMEKLHLAYGDIITSVKMEVVK